MARILLGWELGAGTGHAVKLAGIAKALRARGHLVTLAMQDIAAAPAGEAAWQAPLWPQQLTINARRSGRMPVTMGDILAVLGLTSVAAVTSMIRGWDNILAATRAEAVIAEYAPILMLAARGRMPVIGLGTGFSLPPHDAQRFQRLIPGEPLHDEAALLAGVNRALAQTGRATIAALPQIFAADRSLPAAFRELDPYAARRREAAAAPSLTDVVPLSAGDGDELFVYMNGSQARPQEFWRGLAASGVPVRAHDPRLLPGDVDTLERAGITIERTKIGLDRIVERSRLVLSHGGLGFASSALLAGIPHIVAPFDLEKRLISAGLTAAGLGLEILFSELQTDSFAAFLRQAMADQALVDRARRAAPDFRARIARSCEEETADALEACL